MANTQIYYSATSNQRFQMFLWILKRAEKGADPGQLSSSEVR